MAIAENRIDVTPIKESVKTSVSSGSNSNPKEYKSIGAKISDGFNAGSKLVEGKINAALSGVSSTIGTLLDKGIPKNLSFNTNKLGFFENILCGKLPDLGLRLKLPKIKADFNYDIKFGLDVTICGNSKKVNPVDAALTVVNAIRDPKTFLDQTKADLVNKLLDQGGEKILNKLGMGKLSDCIRDSVMSNLNDAFGENGLTLREKLNMFDAVTTEDCTGDLLQDLKNQANIQNRIAGAIIGKVTSLGDWTLGGQLLDKIIVSDKEWGINGIGDLLKWPTYNSKPDESNYLSTQLRMMHGIFGEKHHGSRNLSMSEYYASYKLNKNYNKSDVLPLKAKSDYILGRLASESVQKDNDEQFDSILTTLNIMDPNWTKDTEGNTNLYRAQDNELMDTLARGYLETRTKTFDLTKTNVTTVIDMGDMIAINNGFDSETYERVMIS